ncbi:MAG: hypothetical protein R3C30_09825 [Hyphomonadaceae bacterium]
MTRLVALIAALALIAGAPVASAQAPAAECPSTQVLDAAPNLVRAGDEAALAQFIETAPCHYWITFYFAAEHLFNVGRKDEAARWFYVAQLRGRTVALLDPGSTPSTIQALQFVIGQPINVEAGADQTKMVEAIDWAIAWDRQNPMQLESIRRVGRQVAPGVMQHSFDPSRPIPTERISPAPTQSQLDEAYVEQRNGIAGLRMAIASIPPEEWIRQRQANGLER